jgi:hypothetical protein
MARELTPVRYPGNEHQVNTSHVREVLIEAGLWEEI